ncbi:MAG: glycosyltransferase family 39 protein [Halioglobus sp.]
MISAVRLPQPLNSRDAVWLMIIVAASSLIRFYHLGHASLWLDEAFSVKIANLPLSTLWISAYDPTPPLHYTVIRFVMRVLGDSEFWLRLPSALCGILTIPVIYLAVRRLADTGAAVVAASVLALSFYNIGYAQEARTYALVSFSIAVSFLGLITLWQNWSKQSSGIQSFMRLGGQLVLTGAARSAIQSQHQRLLLVRDADILSALVAHAGQVQIPATVLDGPQCPDPCLVAALGDFNPLLS